MLGISISLGVHLAAWPIASYIFSSFSTPYRLTSHFFEHFIVIRYLNVFFFGVIESVEDDQVRFSSFILVISRILSFSVSFKSCEALMDFNYCLMNACLGLHSLLIRCHPKSFGAPWIHLRYLYLQCNL